MSWRSQVVVSMGEALYLPSYWFHYIVSQDASIQVLYIVNIEKMWRKD